jgi:hypothetical protein
VPTSRAWTATSTVDVFAVVAVGACSPRVENTAAEVLIVHKPQITPGQQVPPTGAPVLTIIDGADRMVFDLAGLERLGTAESRLFEPYVKQEVTFEGVPARDLMAYLGLHLQDQIHAVALDGLDLDIGVRDLITSKALLATRLDGHPIDIADGGPTRMVFPGDPLASDLSRWIWSLDTLTVVRADS